MTNKNNKVCNISIYHLDLINLSLINKEIPEKDISSYIIPNNWINSYLPESDFQNNFLNDRETIKSATTKFLSSLDLLKINSLSLRLPVSENSIVANTLEGVIEGLIDFEQTQNASTPSNIKLYIADESNYKLARSVIEQKYSRFL